MKNKFSDKLPYIKLILLLLFPLLLITFYSFSEKEYHIGDFILEKANIKSRLMKPGSNRPIKEAGVKKTGNYNETVIDTASQRILFFGDSMVEGLSRRMCEYAKENHHHLLNVIWYSSSTKLWAQSDTLSYFIKKQQPTYIMISIGGNELFIRDIEKRDACIKSILRKIGNIPYIWIGPPNWKEDTGINQLIEQNVGKSQYFPSKNLTFERGSDKVHPTFASAAKWMDTVAVWISGQSKFPICLNKPRTREKSGKTIVLAPLR